MLALVLQRACVDVFGKGAGASRKGIEARFGCGSGAFAASRDLRVPRRLSLRHPCLLHHLRRRLHPRRRQRRRPCLNGAFGNAVTDTAAPATVTKAHP